MQVVRQLRAPAHGQDVAQELGRRLEAAEGDEEHRCGLAVGAEGGQVALEQGLVKGADNGRRGVRRHRDVGQSQGAQAGEQDHAAARGGGEERHEPPKVQLPLRGLRVQPCARASVARRRRAALCLVGTLK